MLIFGTLITKTAAKIGRAQAIVLFKGLGVLFLFVFVFLTPHFTDHPFFALVPPFLLSTALSDSTYPIEESILMDFVPKERRGR